MKTITINLYKFSELSKEAQERAILNHINFEIEIMDEVNSPYYHHAVKMEEMRTPWFLAETIYSEDKQSIIETIEANDYDFTENGELYNSL